jgi:hypothetical protein
MISQKAPGMKSAVALGAGLKNYLQAVNADPIRCDRVGVYPSRGLFLTLGGKIRASFGT